MVITDSFCLIIHNQPTISDSMLNCAVVTASMNELIRSRTNVNFKVNNF
jgi:hypothetical protein